MHPAMAGMNSRVDVVSASYEDGKIAWYENRLVGDANDDGIFNSTDLLQVFQAGEYEDDIPRNTTYEEGDWNNDGEFDSSDLLLAFQAGVYQATAMPPTSDIAAAIDVIFAEMSTKPRARTFVA